MRKLLYTVAEATTLTGICRSKLYELMAARAIESVKVGRSRYIPADALEEYVAQLRATHAA